MKNIAITFLLLWILGGTSAIAQPKYVAEYTFSHKSDAHFSERWVLLFNDDQSVCRSLDRWIADSTRRAEVLKKGFGGEIHAKSNNFNNMIIQNYLAQDSLLVYQNVIGYYVYPEGKLNFNWQLSTDTLSIQGYVCQKATGIHPVLHEPITAWYCSEIAIPVGPVRINGLPGLVLKVQTPSLKLDLVRFSTQITKRDLALYELPKDAVATTFTAFQKIQKYARENPTEFLQQKMPQISKIRVESPE